MAISVYKTFSAGEVLTAADLNASFTQIVNNGTDVAFPATKNAAMGGFVLTGLGAGAANGESIRYEQWVGAQPREMCEFRLTLTSGLAVTTGDVSGVGTLYCAPYKGTRIALYDGTTWNVRTSAEFSIASPATTGTNYDVFCYDNSGTPTLELTAWTNDTTRATALTTQDGVFVKTGALTRRYLGTVRTVSSTLYDSSAFRYVWNYYNRVRRTMRVLETTNSWAYATATIRQANGAVANQLDFVVGVSEDCVSADIYVHAAETGGATTGTLSFVGVGVDSTTTFDAANILMPPQVVASNIAYITTAHWKGYVGVGRRFLSWNERGGGVGTTTWYGDNNLPGLMQGGIHGELFA
jgi:hypothetical protein